MKKHKLLKVSEFFKENIPPFLLGAFFQRTLLDKDNKLISTYTNYRISKKADISRDKFIECAHKYFDVLNKYSGKYPFWESTNDITTTVNFNFDIENDLNLNEEEFYNKLFKKIIFEFLDNSAVNDELNDQKKDFLRGFMELRGSIDTKRRYITQDYFYISNNKLHAKRIEFLLRYFSIPFYYFNINFRQLQPQYYNDVIKRNTQFRINSNWYMKNIGVMNPYKATIFDNGSGNNFKRKIQNGIIYFECDVPEPKYDNAFIQKRLDFYLNRVLVKKPNDKELKKLRSELQFDMEKTGIRNYNLVKAILVTRPDVCACCNNTNYNLIKKKSGETYFEVHHVISLGHDKELDTSDNMVKLCPNCHAILKKGRAEKEQQIACIKKIFKNEPTTLEFAKMYFNTQDFNTVVEDTWKELK